MNPADICRECGLLDRAQQLEQAGNRLSNRIADVLDSVIDESALRDAVQKWGEAKDKSQ